MLSKDFIIVIIIIVSKVESWAHASSSGVYPARKLQLRFACGLDIGHSL